MKRLVLTYILVFISFISYSQDKKKDENVKIDESSVVESIGKLSASVGRFVNFIYSEAKQFKKEFNENLSPEEKEGLKEFKNMVKYELNYAHDAIHAGFAQGIRGEEYTPPYKNKYRNK